VTTETAIRVEVPPSVFRGNVSCCLIVSDYTASFGALTGATLFLGRPLGEVFRLLRKPLSHCPHFTSDWGNFCLLSHENSFALFYTPLSRVTENRSPLFRLNDSQVPMLLMFFFFSPRHFQSENHKHPLLWPRFFGFFFQPFY